MIIIESIGYREIIGILTVVMSIALNGSYLLHTLQGKLTPHPFSWIIWVSITCIIFFAQISDNAGPGAWMTGVTGILGIVIVIASLRNGFGNITNWDKVIFALSLCAIPLWVITNNAMASVILLTLTNTLAYIPTFRKSIDRPYEEPVYLYSINFFRHGLSIIALSNISVITALAPIGLVFNNGLLALFLLWRRYKIKK